MHTRKHVFFPNSSLIECSQANGSEMAGRAVHPLLTALLTPPSTPHYSWASLFPVDFRCPCSFQAPGSLLHQELVQSPLVGSQGSFLMGPVLSWHTLNVSVLCSLTTQLSCLEPFKCPFFRPLPGILCFQCSAKPAEVAVTMSCEGQPET